MRLVALLFLLVLELPLTAADKVLQEQWKVAVKNALALSNQWLPGGPPFTLKGRIRFLRMQTTEGFVDGTYRLDWASPESWREQISIGGYDGVTIQKGESLAKKANLPRMPLRVYQLNELLSFAILRRREKYEVLGVQNALRDGRKVRCFLMARESQACFDAVEGFFLGFTNPLAEYIYGNHVVWGDKRLPRKFVDSLATEKQVQLDVDAILAFDKPASAPEEIPGDATVSCAEPTPAVLLKRASASYPPFQKINGVGGVVGVYATISTEGKLVDPEIYQSPGKQFDAAVLESLTEWRYKPAYCGTTPIATQTDINIRYDPARAR